MRCPQYHRHEYDDPHEGDEGCKCFEHSFHVFKRALLSLPNARLEARRATGIRLQTGASPRRGLQPDGPSHYSFFPLHSAVMPETTVVSSLYSVFHAAPAFASIYSRALRMNCRKSARGTGDLCAPVPNCIWYLYAYESGRNASLVLPEWIVKQTSIDQGTKWVAGMSRLTGKGTSLPLRSTAL